MAVEGEQGGPLACQPPCMCLSPINMFAKKGQEYYVGAVVAGKQCQTITLKLAGPLLVSQHPQMPTQNSLANAIPNLGTLRGRPTKKKAGLHDTKQAIYCRSSPHPASVSVTSSANAPGIVAMRYINVPEDWRQEYSIVFDNLWRFVIEVDCCRKIS